MLNPKLFRNKKIACIIVCIIISFYSILTVSAQSTIVKAEASTSQPRIGETLTVAIKISNVQNLAGIDINVNWDPQVLSLSNVALNLGVESHPDGVLHGNKLNYDSDTLVSGDIFVQEERLQGSYNLLAQSIGQTTPAFSGSGTAATLTFNVSTTGPAELAIESELADHPPAGENANLIEHQDVVDTVTAVIPEIPSIAIVILAIALASMSIIVHKKRFSKISRL